MNVNDSRFAYVDTLRGFAALAVIYFHSSLDALNTGRTSPGLETAIFSAFTQSIDLGKVAVILFFAVSGFVIPFSLDKRRPKPITSFFIGRVFRLYPAYWVSILGAIIVNYWMTSTALSVTVLLSNLTMLHFFVGLESMQGLFWTLQIELIFYAFCVAIFVFYDIRSVRVATCVAIAMLAAAILAAAGRYVTGIALPVAIPLSLFVMFVGLLWRLAVVDNTREARRAVGCLSGIFALAMPGVAVLAYGDDAVRYVATYFTAIAIFMVFTTKLKVQSRALSFLGAISYSVYLFGSLVQKTIETQAGVFFGSGAMPIHVMIAAVMAITILIATLVYRFIELPSISAGKSLIWRQLNGIPKRSDAAAL